MPTVENVKPRLRPVQARPVQRQGQQWFALVDSSGLSEAQVALTSPAFFVVTHFDGVHTLASVRAAFQERFNQPLPMEQLRGLIEQLDEAMLLDSPRFAAAMQAQIDAYVASDVRPMREEALPPEELLLPMIERIVQPIDRTGVASSTRRLLGLVAPHLDYPRGLPLYTAAYGTLAAQVQVGQVPELVVVLGTNHYGMRAGPVATNKDFETLFGRVAGDSDAVYQMNDLYGDDLLQGQYDHLREHSVELQVHLLARIIGSDRFKILPLILPDACEKESQESLSRLAAAILRVAAERDGSMLIVAGADLSHVGSHFGDERPLEPAWLTHVADSDRTMVKQLRMGRPDGFVDGLRDNSNITRICSTGSLYVLRRILDHAAWQDLGYHQACDAEGGTCVTCIAAALWDE